MGEKIRFSFWDFPKVLSEQSISSVACFFHPAIKECHRFQLNISQIKLGKCFKSRFVAPLTFWRAPYHTELCSLQLLSQNVWRCLSFTSWIRGATLIDKKLGKVFFGVSKSKIFLKFEGDLWVAAGQTLLHCHISSPFSV